MSRRYLLFGGFCYYPQGGWNDLICSSDSLKTIQHRCDLFYNDPEIDSEYMWENMWHQVIDTRTNKEIDKIKPRKKERKGK